MLLSYISVILRRIRKVQTSFKHRILCHFILEHSDEVVLWICLVSDCSLTDSMVQSFCKLTVAQLAYKVKGKGKFTGCA